MNLVIDLIFLSLFCFYTLFLGTDAGTRVNLLEAAKPTETKIPANPMSEFYRDIDSQEYKYEEALKAVKKRKPHHKKTTKRRKFDTENELALSRRNLHRKRSENENASESSFDIRNFSKNSQNNKIFTKSKRIVHSKKAKKKNIYKHITPMGGENSPIDIIIHIKMRETDEGKPTIEVI